MNLISISESWPSRMSMYCHYFSCQLLKSMRNVLCIFNPAKKSSSESSLFCSYYDNMVRENFFAFRKHALKQRFLGLFQNIIDYRSCTHSDLDVHLKPSSLSSVNSLCYLVLSKKLARSIDVCKSIF